MKKQGQFSGTWQNKNHKVQVNIPLYIFEENDTIIYYCPALDVYGYGDNDKQARESFEISLSEFFTYTLNKKTFLKEMQRLGWTTKKNKHKPMTPPSLNQMIETNEEFSNLLNNVPFRKIHQNIEIPA